MDGNIQKGAAFATRVGDHLKRKGHDIEPEYEVEIGVNRMQKKAHKFDWGSESLVVECKAYDWTKGDNIPSAKLTTINEAMLYFLSTPQSFRKMLFMLATSKRSARNPETLAEYYVRTHAHLIPGNVEVYEFDHRSLSVRRLSPVSAEQEKEPDRTRVVSSPDGCEKHLSADLVLHLKLYKTYYNQGFFNIPREFDHLAGGEGLVTLVLRGHGRIQGRINRRANLNGTARIMGRAELCNWFQRNYSEGDTVPVRFDAPRRLNLGEGDLPPEN